MRSENTDERFEAIMKRLLAQSSMDESTVDEIADSPAIWWSVQRNIAEQRSAASEAWPPVGKLRRLLAFAIPAAAAIAVFAGIYVYRPADDRLGSAALVAPTVNVVSIAKVNGTSETKTTAIPVVSRDNKTLQVRKQAKSESLVAKRATNERAPKRAEKNEIKTDFIALSYARDAESGQIVRVKVPSSMMVTLGLVSTVEKPAALVDAEVIVGDDGLTRAIRFIR